MTHWPWNALIVLSVLAAANIAFLFAGWRWQKIRKPTPPDPRESAVSAGAECYLKDLSRGE